MLMLVIPLLHLQRKITRCNIIPHNIKVDFTLKITVILLEVVLQT